MSCWVCDGKLTVPDGAGGSAALSAAFTVPSLISVGSSIGRALPASHRFWPVVEYRYSSHSRAAAGCGASLLIAWS